MSVIGPNVTGKKFKKKNKKAKAKEPDLESEDQEMAVKAVVGVAPDENLAPYVGHILKLTKSELDAFKGEGDATHLIELKSGMYIDPRPKDRRDCIAVDVGWLGYGRLEFNLAMRANTAGNFMKHNFNIQNNCTFHRGSTNHNVVWLRSSSKILKGKNFYCNQTQSSNPMFLVSAILINVVMFRS